MKYLEIHAHSSDRNTVIVRKPDGEEIFLADGDYVPYDIGIGGGDSVQLTIDIETGHIVNWDPQRFLLGVQILLGNSDDE